MKEINIKFKTELAEKHFKELFEHVLGVSIDGSGEIQCDNYGTLQYESHSKQEIIVDIVE
jgi:hypothetical protein